jgi:hypothetical protein
VLIRLLLLSAIGMVGCSSIYWLVYLALPAIAALLIVQHGGGRYLAEDAPVVVRILRWLSAAYAYLWLLTDRFPTSETPYTVDYEVDVEGTPTGGSALLRLVYSVPAVLLLAILSVVAGLFWVIGAIAILVSRRLPSVIADFLELTLRFQFRLAAYHLSLVDRYPSGDQAPIAPGAAHPGAV